MISFLFWNLAGNEKTVPRLRRLAESRRIDVLLLAECPDNLGAIGSALREVSDYRLANEAIKSKVKAATRLGASNFVPGFNNRKGDLTIWKLQAGGSHVQVAVVHVMSKAGGAKSEDQHSVAGEIAREIAEFEDIEGSRDTILVGDLNMNPFETGLVAVSGLHAVMTKEIAGRADRKWREKAYRRFYNPMWGLFGDRTPGPAGTYFWNKSIPSNQHWHMFDQVLVRPSLMDRLRCLDIIDNDGEMSLLDQSGIPDKESASDHLPIYFEVDI